MSLSNFLLYSLSLISICELKTVLSLQITELFVPKEANREAVLDCRYSLEFNETLYDVKWYKDGSQFFRCKPDGTKLEFPLVGVQLLKISELAKAGTCSLTLIELNENSTGIYDCEVSLDFPFHTQTKGSRLEFNNFTSGDEFGKDYANTNEANVVIFVPRLSVIVIVLIVFVNKCIHFFFVS